MAAARKGRRRGFFPDEGRKGLHKGMGEGDNTEQQFTGFCTGHGVKENDGVHALTSPLSIVVEWAAITTSGSVMDIT